MEFESSSLLGILLITLGVSLLGLLGGFFLIWKESVVQRWARYLISFAAGSILGATFLNLLPEAFEHSDQDGGRMVILMMLIGILVFFILEKLLVWHHHSHEDEVEGETVIHNHKMASARPLIIIGDALHNLLDGAIIAIAFMADPSLGFISALAVIAHEIPQEIGDFSILIHSGMSKKKVIWWNFIGAAISPLGALIVYFSSEFFTDIELPLLGFVIGNFIYIALADLVPTIQHERKISRSLVQLVCMLVGVGIFWQLGVLLPHK
ncbi:MAG: ZIP family metal transporter [bacterium]|nr:ZIP family metal transporter [bacterium]